MTTWFLSFADRRFKSSDLIRREAQALGVFDNIITGDQRLLERWYRCKYRKRFKDRGYGYWQWKPYLIRRLMDRMEEGDLLLYSDAGCILNEKGKKRMMEYFDIVKHSPSGVLLFNQHYPETQYTKGDVFDYFGVTNNPQYTNHGQIASGIIFIEKKPQSQKMIDEWSYICHNHYELLTDNPSTTPNAPNFIAHRHDQSILSLLAVKYGVSELPTEEVYTEENWQETMSDYPIWACRRRKIRFFHKCHLALRKYLLRK